MVGQLKTKQEQIKGLMSKETLKEARKYAETSRQEIQKLLKGTDVKKVKTLIAKEAGELKKLQESIPGELAKLSRYVEGQKKEFEKILKNVTALEAATYIQKKVNERVKKGKKKTPARKATVVKEAAVKESAPRSAESAVESDTGTATPES